MHCVDVLMEGVRLAMHAPFLTAVGAGGSKRWARRWAAAMQAATAEPHSLEALRNLAAVQLEQLPLHVTEQLWASKGMRHIECASRLRLHQLCCASP